jgi:hypothetical protein
MNAPKNNIGLVTIKILRKSVNGRSMNKLHTNALQNVQQHGCQPEIN